MTHVHRHVSAQQRTSPIGFLSLKLPRLPCAVHTGMCVYTYSHDYNMHVHVYIYIYIYTCVYVVPLERNKENMTTLGAILCVWKTLSQRV